MDNKMFCFQCEQTAGCTGCTGKAGVCGKKSDTAGLQDTIVGPALRRPDDRAPAEKASSLHLPQAAVARFSQRAPLVGLMTRSTQYKSFPKI